MEMTCGPFARILVGKEDALNLLLGSVEVCTLVMDFYSKLAFFKTVLQELALIDRKGWQHMARDAGPLGIAIRVAVATLTTDVPRNQLDHQSTVIICPVNPLCLKSIMIITLSM